MLGWLVTAALAGPLDGHFVYEPFVEAVETERASNWHPNRIVPELKVTGEAAVLDFHGPSSCTLEGDDDDRVLTCGDDAPVPVRWVDGGDVVVVDLPGEDGARLRRSSWTVVEWYRGRRLEETIALVPRVEGRWTREGQVLQLSARTAAADAERWQLAHCHDEERQTVCLVSRGDDREVFVLRGDTLVPVLAMPEHTCGEDTHDVDLAVDRLFVVEDGSGAPWVRDAAPR